MGTPFRVRCERIRVNNGIIEVLFSRRSDMSDKTDQDEEFLFNIKIPPDRYEVGRYYWLVNPYPAFPS